MESLMYARGEVFPSESFSSSYEKLDYISKVLYRLASPADTPICDYRMLSVKYNESYTEVAIEFEQGYKTYVHPLVDEHILDHIIQPYVDAGQAPASVIQYIQDLINNNRGLYVVVNDVLPQFILDRLLTIEQMRTFDYFPLPPQLPSVFS